MRPVSSVTRLWVGLLALAGVAGAHALAYLFVAPDPHERIHLLAQTGHATWFWPGAALFAALVAASVETIASRGRSRASGWLGVGLAMASLQVGGFVVLEAAERATSGGSALQLVTEPVFLIGLVAQLLVAVLITLVLSVVVRVVVALRRPRSGHATPRRSPQPRPLRSITPLRISPARCACGTRGPPLHLSV